MDHQQDPNEFPLLIEHVTTIGTTGQKIVDLLISEGGNEAEARSVARGILADIGKAVAAGDFCGNAVAGAVPEVPQ